MLDSANTLNFWYDNLVSRLAFVRTRLLPIDQNDEADTLQLVFPGEFELDRLAELLSRVSKFYSDVSAVLDDHEPLRVVKIETGSAWIKLAGAAGTIQLARLILKHCFSVFTMRSQIALSDEKIAHVGRLQSLIKKFERDGYDVTSHKERLLTITDELLQNGRAIVAMEPRVLIDGKWVSPYALGATRVFSESPLPRDGPKQIE